MRHEQSGIRHSLQIKQSNTKGSNSDLSDFVLEKSIFNNIFEKDIRRVFIYKKSERLAKAIHLISPAFTDSVALRNRLDTIALELVDCAILPPLAARLQLSRTLLALSSILSMARTGGLLSSMNADLIAHEAHALLQEVASYEQPRLSLEESPTLSGIAKNAQSRSINQHQKAAQVNMQKPRAHQEIPKGHLKDIRPVENSGIKDRREGILSVIKNKGKASIKDISTVIRGVSEKTIQRELSSLISDGVVLKQGDRRWSTYSLI